MFETLESIREQILAGEDSFAEFKELRYGDRSVVSPNSEDIAGEMVAFANAEGGALFLGVTDQGLIQGIPKERANVVENWAINIASNNCDPPIRPLIRKVVLPNPDGQSAEILLVLIKKSLYVHRTSPGRWYVRVGSTKRDMTQHELSRLFQQRGRSFVFDEMQVHAATEADLDRAALQTFFGSASIVPWEQLLANTRVLTKDEDGTLRPTVAGLLIFGSNPKTHLPSAFIEAAVYRGLELDSNHLVHSEQIDGSLGRQIDGAVAFVSRFMLKPAKKDAGRIEYPQFAVAAVHEAIVNAVAHRDYSISGSKIRLFLFDDRLELMSPGELPNTITLETLPYRQFTRNQLLVSFLAKLRSQRTGRAFIEARGEGVRKILSESEAHSGRRPQYRLAGQELLLTIWAKPSPHEQAV
jgi:predicted HTH transcriptional regulator